MCVYIYIYTFIDLFLCTCMDRPSLLDFVSLACFWVCSKRVLTLEDSGPEKCLGTLPATPVFRV